MLPIGARRALLGNRVYAYLLGPFRFAVDTAAPLPNPYSEAGAVGSLTVTDTGNKLSVTGGKLAFAAGTGTWGDPGLVPASLSRVVGRTVIGTIRLTTIATGAFFGWFNSATPIDTNTIEAIRVQTGQGWRIGEIANGSAQTSLDAASTATDYIVYIILRGTGAYFFVSGGAFVNPTLLWVSAIGSQSPLWSAFINKDNVGTLDNLRVIDLGPIDSRFATDFGLALNRSTFTAANGTALTAIVPEAGGVWTHQNGSTWEVQSNKAKALSAPVGEPKALAIVNAALADGVVELTVNGGGSAINGAIVLRYDSATKSHFLVYLSNVEFSLYEFNGTTYTQRATVAVSPSGSTDHRIIAIAEGSTITAYFDNANKITYSSATLNQATTVHGIRSTGTTTSFDDFVIYPRTLTLPSGV
jgi:hypothetical protein